MLGHANSKQKRQVSAEFISIPCMRYKENNGTVIRKQVAVLATIRNDILSNT